MAQCLSVHLHSRDEIEGGRILLHSVLMTRQLGRSSRGGEGIAREEVVEVKKTNKKLKCDIRR